MVGVFVGRKTEYLPHLGAHRHLLAFNSYLFFALGNQTSKSARRLIAGKKYYVFFPGKVIFLVLNDSAALGHAASGNNYLRIWVALYNSRITNHRRLNKPRE